MSTVYFKRQGGGTSSPTVAKAPTSLAYGEPAIDSAGVIYVGNGKGEVVSKVKHAALRRPHLLGADRITEMRRKHENIR